VKSDNQAHTYKPKISINFLTPLVESDKNSEATIGKIILSGLIEDFKLDGKSGRAKPTIFHRKGNMPIDTGVIFNQAVGTVVLRQGFKFNS